MATKIGSYLARKPCVLFARTERKPMDRRLIGLVLAASVLFLSNTSIAAQTPDGTVKITTRMVSPGVGLSWGEGVLTYKGQGYPFTFQAKGMFRDVDPDITAAELSGEVFNLKTLQLFNGSYHEVKEKKSSKTGSGSRATMKNLNGVVIHLVSSVEGRKFVLNRDGMKIELKKEKR